MAGAGRAARKVPASKKVSAAKAVDRQLARYRSMRNFHVTAEPHGGTSTSLRGHALPFCVQKHAASHLHYDFRLGWNGVLKSWACAKGPSCFPGDKRLAVQVEDHPIEYGGFEGMIPAGQYGGGTVMLWDQGTWEPQPGYVNVDAGLQDGSLKFILHGTKLQGKWALIRMKNRPGETKPNWLLIKERDAFACSKDDVPMTEAEPDSVITGRSIEQIARSGDHVWNSRDTGRKDTPARKEKVKISGAAFVARWAGTLRKLPREVQPRFVKPQLAISAAQPPSGAGWVHELKLDGYRVQARKDGNHIQMLTRSGLDWTDRFKATAAEVAKLNVKEATLDGEVVVLMPDGGTSFADLQASFQTGAGRHKTYCCFDLLHVNGSNLRGLPLTKRKEMLEDLLSGADDDLLQVSEHIPDDGERVFDKACELHAEGIVSKKTSGHYMPGRSGDWLKTKCLLQQEFVIGGYTHPSNGTHGVGALLLGYYEYRKLIYAGRTGTGFTGQTHRLLRKELEPLKQDSMPFASVPAGARRGVTWVRPTLVAQVRFAEWTADRLVRQAAFLGLREDKAAEDVRRENNELAPQRSEAKTRTNAAVNGVRLTHPDKVLDDESGMTKRMLADYYAAIAEWMLPYIANRPLSLVRCPDGSSSTCFFQKHVTGNLPRGIGSVDIQETHGKVEPYCTLHTKEGLTELAQIAALEIHPWGSRNDDLERPDRLIFDLDPDEDLKWSVVAAAAMEVRSRFKKLKLESFVKTTGGKGLHVVVPIVPALGWSAIKEFARDFALAMEKDNPALYLTRMTKSARRGKIFIDYLRNERGATSVAAYSPRARAGAPVSMPLHWKELKLEEKPVFKVADYARWKRRLKNDPWDRFASIRQRIPI